MSNVKNTLRNVYNEVTFDNTVLQHNDQKPLLEDDVLLHSHKTLASGIIAKRKLSIDEAIVNGLQHKNRTSEGRLYPLTCGVRELGKISVGVALYFDYLVSISLASGNFIVAFFTFLFYPIHNQCP